MMLAHPPWEALRLYADARDRVPPALLEGAVCTLLEAMRDARVDFASTNAAGASLLVHAIAHCRCSRALLTKLLSLGCQLSDEELASGQGMAVILRHHDTALTALEHLALRPRNLRQRAYANTRIEAMPDGGTALHLACREAPIYLLERYVEALVLGLGVSPALLNDRLQAPHQLLAEERLVPGVTSEGDRAVLTACIHRLMALGGQAYLHRKHAVHGLRHALDPDAVHAIAVHSLAA